MYVVYLLGFTYLIRGTETDDVYLIALNHYVVVARSRGSGVRTLLRDRLCPHAAIACTVPLPLPLSSSLLPSDNPPSPLYPRTDR